LDSCGDCKTNRYRCKCWKNKLVCTFYCKCNVDSCNNQPSSQKMSSTTQNNSSIDDTDNEGSLDESVINDKDYTDVSFVS
ncbi:unnamed protein product, partial [Rotaria magnacalcarata]